MKLFIWCDPYQVSYGSSMVVVVAKTVEDARELAIAGKMFTFGKYEKDPATAALASLVAKEPDRVTKCPCAEWHEWSE